MPSVCPGQEPPAPENQRNEKDGRGKANRLHQNVGDNRTRSAKRIADRSAGGMVEAWVVDRPGGKGGGQSCGERDDAETGRHLSDCGVKSVWPDFPYPADRPAERRLVPRTALARLMPYLPTNLPIVQERFPFVREVPQVPHGYSCVPDCCHRIDRMLNSCPEALSRRCRATEIV